MIGYHYTTYKHWQKIQKEGLRPAPLRKWEIERYKPGAWGTWLWENLGDPRAHLGSIMRCIAYKNKTHIVLLQVKYYKKEMIAIPGWGKVSLCHEGTFQNFHYHDNVPAIILDKVVPPTRVKLFAEYDMLQLVGVDNGALR